MTTCNTFWGSHGCELPRRHDPEQEHPIHECSVETMDDNGVITGRGVCSQAQYVDDERVRTRFTSGGILPGWGAWHEVALPLFRNDEEKAR